MECSKQLKEEPLIPAFTLLTCFALIQASRQMNKGNQKSMNKWLRARVIAQGATIAALLGYSYVYGFGKFAPAEVKHDDAERRKLNAERERERFQERMREVEGIHRAETGESGIPNQQKSAAVTYPDPSKEEKKSSTWSSWLGWGKKN